jgi:transposase
MTSSKESIKVITSVERRRRWSPAEKKAIVQETYEPGKTVSYVARIHGIQPAQLFYWKRRMEDGAMTGIGSEEEVVPVSELKTLHAKVKQLERILGQKTVENEILKEAVRIGREKKLISRQPLLGVADFE